MAEANSPTRRSRWFQISLRTLLAVVLGFGLGLAVNYQFRGETSPIHDPNHVRRGDRLALEFNPSNFANPARRTVEVLADGSIRLPGLGKVTAAGLSLDELTEDLNQRYTAHYSSLHGQKLTVEVFVTFENTSVEEHRAGK